MQFKEIIHNFSAHQSFRTMKAIFSILILLNLWSPKDGEDVFCGWFDGNGVFHAFVTDSRGNIAAVVNSSTGTVEQRTHYYPYGAPTSESTGASVNAYKYSGKELTTLAGLHLYDFHARQYQPLTGMFSSQDPKAWDYTWLSPYSYCGGDPINSIDPTGEDIVILLYDGTIIGHLAMLIQDENKKWRYYSINGDNVFVSGLIFSGGRKFDDIGIGSWDSPADFFNSSYNENGDGDDKSINSYGYEEGYLISTTPEQDKTMSNYFMSISKYEEYSITNNNCAHAVQRSMAKAGSKTDWYYVLPVNAYNNIVNLNPSGKKYIEKRNESK